MREGAEKGERGAAEHRGRYALKAKELCWSCWTSAANREEVWHSVNTRITYEAVFEYYRIRLKRVGVVNCKSFRDIVRAEAARRNRALEAKRDAADFSRTTKPPHHQTKQVKPARKNDILRGR